MKTCSMCRQAKALSEFHKNKRTKDGHSSRCKECAKSVTRDWYSKNPERAKASSLQSRKNNPDSYWRRYYKRQYGITLERYEEMLAQQGGVCAMCKKECRTRDRLSVDHNHSCCPGGTSCGQCVRGLLCMRCNQGIGHLGDSIDLLQAAIDYLTES